MATKNTLGTIADIKSVVFRSETSRRFNVDETEELDQLSESINLIASDTDFTMLLKSEEKKKIEGELKVRKSAFDILEDFVDREESLRQNLADPKVVDISQLDVIFNAPEIDDEFEALRAQEIAEVEASEAELEFQNFQKEAEDLEKALDFAFEQLTGEKLTDGEMDFDVDSNIDNLDFSIDEAILKGKDFGLDLAFLNEVSVPVKETEGE